MQVSYYIVAWENSQTYKLVYSSAEEMAPYIAVKITATCVVQTEARTTF